MPNRSAADFSREAKVDDPWTYTLKNGKTIRPRPRSWYTYDEQVAEAELQLAWAKRAQSYENNETPDGPEPEPMFRFGLKTRFGKDFDRFWSEVKDWPAADLVDLVNELDEYYDPTPADKSEKDAAATEGGDGETAGKSPSGGES